MAAVALKEAMAQRHYPFCTVGGSTGGKLFCKARMTAEMSSVMQPQGNEWSQQTVGEQMGQKMSSESLTRSEVFGQLRRELYGEERSSHSSTHLFIILGASVSTALKTALSCSI